MYVIVQSGQELGVLVLDVLDDKIVALEQLVACHTSMLGGFFFHHERSESALVHPRPCISILVYGQHLLIKKTYSSTEKWLN